MTTPTIDEMLASARKRARKPVPDWWTKISRYDVPTLFRECLQRAGARVSKETLDTMARVYTWKDFWAPHVQEALKGPGGPDPQETIVRDIVAAIKSRRRAA